MALYDPADPNSEDATLPTAPAPQNEPAPQPQVPQMKPAPQADMQDQAQSASLPPAQPQRVTDEQMKNLPVKAFDAYKDPAVLNKLAVSYLENGFPEGVAWLAHVHSAVKEGQVEATQRLIAGDGKGAVEAWNRGGDRNYDATDATKNDDGTWTITHTGGNKTIVDPHQEMASMLSPQAFVQNEQHKAELAQKAKLNDAQADYYRKHGTYMEKAGKFQDERAGMMEGIANIKAAAQREHDRLGAMVKQGQIDASVAGQKLEEQYGPQAVYMKMMDVLKSDAQSSPAEKDIQATKSVMQSGSGEAVMTAPGQVQIMNSRTHQPWGAPIPAATFAKNFPDTPVRKPPPAASNARPNVPAEATPSSGKFVAPPAPAPVGPVAGMTAVPQNAPTAAAAASAPAQQPMTGEARRVANMAANRAAAQQGGQQQAAVLQQSFDADMQKMDPVSFAQKYDAARNALTPQQLQTLNTIVSQIK